MNYFPTVNPVHRVHIFVDRLGVLGPPWTDAGTDRGHGGGGAKRREERGELGSGLTGAQAALWRLGDGGAERGGGSTR
jgi:hypothetical protein